MNELKTKTEKTTDGALKRNPWRRLPKGGKIAVIVVGILAVLAVLAALYVNGKLDLLRYDDGSVSEMGEIGADEDQDLDGTGLTHTESEMTMPEGSPFSDDNVLNILLIGTDERTEAVNDADAFTHLNQLDGTEDTTEFSDDARSDSMILVSLDIKDHVIRLVSIERGTGVPILLDGYEGQYDWITHTFRYGGAKLTMKTIEDCFNVQVDHYVRVNFNSFVQIVDAVGGVDLDITEMGRFTTGPYGALVATAIHEKHIYKEYIGLDACAANLMRPAMYGAYHHITVLGKEDAPCDHMYDVVGGLCENNDKFAIDRMLPKIDIGDVLYIHDTGAHGSAMGYNYNGKLRSAEVLLCEDGSHRLIRRAETPRDYFATLDFLPLMKPLFED